MQKALFSLIALFLCISCFCVSVVQTFIPYQWSLEASALALVPALFIVLIYIIVLLALPLLAVVMLWKQFKVSFVKGLEIMFRRSKFYWMLWILNFLVYMSIFIPQQLPKSFAKEFGGIGIFTSCLSIIPAFVLLLLFVRDLGKGQKE